MGLSRDVWTSATVIFVGLFVLGLVMSQPSGPVTLRLTDGDSAYPQLMGSNDTYIGQPYAFGLNCSEDSGYLVIEQQPNATIQFFNFTVHEYQNYSAPILMAGQDGDVLFLVTYEAAGTYSETAYWEASQ